MRSIYVVKTEELGAENTQEVFNAITTRGFFAERAAMEKRPDFQQIIPSFVLRDLFSNKMLVFQRKAKHTEQRLAGMWTPVFGGHIDPEDWDREATHAEVTLKGDLKIPYIVYNGLVREMKEETGIEMNPEYLTWVGLIQDKSNDVGKVHTGALFTYDVIISNELKEQILSKSEINDLIELPMEAIGEFMKSPDHEIIMIFH